MHRLHFFDFEGLNGTQENSPRNHGNMWGGKNIFFARREQNLQTIGTEM